MRFWPFRGRPAAAPPPTNDLLATEELLRKNVEDLLVVRERQIRGGVIVFRGELLLSPSRAVDALLERFRVFGYTPFVHAEAMASSSRRGRWRRSSSGPVWPSTSSCLS